MFRLALGGGLALELLEERHADALYALVDRNREHLGRWFPWVEATRDAGATRGFVAAGLEQFRRGDGFQTGILDGDLLVGCLGLHYLKRPEGVTEIGYWLARDAQGRGIMTRVLRGLLPYLFGELDLYRVEIRCDPENHRSRALPERLGFQQEGVLRRVGLHGRRRYDHVVYALLREEWDPDAASPPRRDPR